MLSCIWLFAMPWTAAHQASLSFTISQSILKFMSIELVMPSNHFILCCPLLLLPLIFPRIRVFSNDFTNSKIISGLYFLIGGVHYKKWREYPDARGDWRQQKRTTDDSVVTWHHQINGHQLNKLQEIVKDRETCPAAVHGMAKSQTRVSGWTTTGTQNLFCISKHCPDLQEMLTPRTIVLVAQRKPSYL